jgi:hypothetical protein
MLDTINLDKFIEIKSSTDSIILQELNEKEEVIIIDFSNMCTPKNVCICACMLTTHVFITFFIGWI